MATKAPENRPRSVPASKSGPGQPAQEWAASPMVRRVFSSPVSLYLWLSGPPMTGRDRMQAELADARNSLYRRNLVV